jgi:NADH dehydrogenase
VGRERLDPTEPEPEARRAIVTRVSDTGLDVVTGAFSYTGNAIARRLLEDGRRVRTLTGHPDRPSSIAGRVEVAPYAFDDFDALTRSLEGASTIYNTYWVRFDRGEVSFDRAIENSKTLFRAAREAGVRRAVHVSVTKPSKDSPFPYFRGKALVEQALADSGLSHAVVRPTIVFGRGDILLNNVAWLLRRLPIFAIPDDGRYRVRPVHVGDVANICVEVARAKENLTIDAVGPETMTFEEMVRRIRAAVGEPFEDRARSGIRFAAGGRRAETAATTTCTPPWTTTPGSLTRRSTPTSGARPAPGSWPGRPGSSPSSAWPSSR